MSQSLYIGRIAPLIAKNSPEIKRLFTDVRVIINGAWARCPAIPSGVEPLNRGINNAENKRREFPFNEQRHVDNGVN
jgi:hypothetical protein